MKNIRKAEYSDLCRIAEIEIFNYRLYFYMTNSISANFRSDH